MGKISYNLSGPDRPLVQSKMSTTEPLGCGILVIEKGYALCGLTPKLGKFSGIGGKPEPGESILQTAFREATEELYGITPSNDLLIDLTRAFAGNRVLERNRYYYVLLSFIDVVTLNALVFMHHPSSPYYKTNPSSVLDLVLNRYATEDAEITELGLKKYGIGLTSLDTEFIKDCLKAESYLNRDVTSSYVE